MSVYLHKKTCRRLNDPGTAHFATFSTFRRQPFLRSETACLWLAESLRRACTNHDMALWAYVFMPEHVHLIVRPRQTAADISQFLKATKLGVANNARRRYDLSDKADPAWERYLDIQPNGQVHFRFWQRGGGYDRNLFSPDEIMEKVNYIHANPVRRGLSAGPDDWRWSSSGDYSGLRCGPVPVEFLDL